MREALSYLIRQSGATYFLRRQKKETITVLCLHRVSDEKDTVWPSMAVKVFQKIINYCNRNYQVILPQQWSENSSKPKMIITFDDGYHDFIEYALPVLFERRMPAVHHVVVDSVLTNRPNWTYRLNLLVADHSKSRKSFSLLKYDIPFSKVITPENAPKIAVELSLLLKDQSITNIEKILTDLEKQSTTNAMLPKMMNSKDLLECEAAGVQIGSHSYTHTYLNKSLSNEVLHHELVTSRQELEKMLGHHVSCFAFPAGMYDDRVLQYSKDAGYDFLFVVEDRFFTSTNKPQPPVIFPRMLIGATGANEAILKIEGFHSLVKKWMYT